MLEFNFWFFVLAANFLALVFILNKLLFQPMLKTFDRRKEAIDGAIEAANEMLQRRAEQEERMRAELAEASRKGKEVFEALRAEGAEAQRRAMEKAAEEAAEVIRRAREQLRAEAERAREQLRADAERFSEDIVDKLIKAR